MNIKSAFGFPTPNTVWVREETRCAHLVQTVTRSRTAASSSALFGVSSRRWVGNVHASRNEVALGVSSSRASAVLEARGARSLFSRIFSSAAMTKSRAGCDMCSDHPKFCVRLQTISLKPTRAAGSCRPGLSGFEIERSKNRCSSQGRRVTRLHPAILPTGRLIQQFQFNVECCLDVHLGGRITNCSDRLIGRCWPLSRNTLQQFSAALAHR